MSSYPVLDNKPIDQWKVVELKEELRRRKLTTKGLKDDLIRRLDASIRQEIESAKGNADNGLDSAPQTVVQSQDAGIELVVDEGTSENMDRNDKTTHEELNNDVVQNSVDDNMGPLAKEQIPKGDPTVGTDSTGLELEKVTEATTKETSVQVTTVDTNVQVTGETSVQVTTLETTTVESSLMVPESLVTEVALSEQALQNSEMPNKSEDLNVQSQIEDSNPPFEEAKLNLSDVDNQVFEVSKVTSDSISTDNVSINEKIDLKDNVIADDVKLEFDVKPEVEVPSSGNVVGNDGDLQSMNVEEPQENNVKVEEAGNNVDNEENVTKNDSGDVDFSEKVNLDRSSGDDSMEEDISESKQIESKSISNEVGDKSEKSEVPVVREDAPVDAMIDDLSPNKKVENTNGLAVPLVKRKLHVQETVGNSETVKRQRRWNSEGLKIFEPQSTDVSPSVTPRDTFQSLTPKDAFKSVAKHNFTRSDSVATDESPKERVVPPSSKLPTTSLRIDHFLRPFTLKAVQELLGKTGTVSNFWMDHIKTHCYVSYSCVEEAIETRNALYNLQWPKNGGRLLVADFVDPQEVKMRLEAPPPPSPSAPINTGPVLPSAPSPRVPAKREVLSPPPPTPLSSSLPPPPPPLSNPPPARGQRALAPPPPPLLPEKVDPPIVTLDDLFRKTKASPRIYYLPLTGEQVANKHKAQEGKTTKQ